MVVACSHDATAGPDGAAKSREPVQLDPAGTAQPLRPMVRVNLDCGFPLKALITNQACQDMGLAEQDEIVALVKAPAIHLIAQG